MVVWQYNDGGRAAAGYKGSTGDCVTRAIAIGTGRPYKEVYDRINQQATVERRPNRSKARTGVFKDTTRATLKAYGWQWIPVMKIGSGCTMHVRQDELPKHPRMILKLSRHLTAVIDGVVQDTYDPSRNGTRAVYGFWIPTGI